MAPLPPQGLSSVSWRAGVGFLGRRLREKWNSTGRRFCVMGMGPVRAGTEPHTCQNPCDPLVALHRLAF
jgi:hypothetical protein